VRIVPLFLCLVIPVLSFAQLEVTTGISPSALVWKELIGPNSGLKIINIKYKGAPYAIGKFKTEAEHIDIKKGIILSTGFAKAAAGPNNAGGVGEYLHQPGDRQLVRLANNVTMDACVLEFDFVPKYNRIEFEFVFASEEYLEFINKGVNDVFGFFLTELNTRKTINLAVVPNTQEAISVDNINHKKNSEYFIKNELWNLNSPKIIEGNHEVNEYAFNFQFDGLTHWLTASADVKPNVAYHLKIAIADAGDGIYDSAVFLKSNSLHAEDKEEENVIKVEIEELFSEEKVTVRGDSIVLELHLNFETDKSETSDPEDLNKLIQITTLMTQNEKLKLKVEGHTDNVGEDSYNQNLSMNRSDYVMKWLETHGIDNQRLSAKGFGSAAPISSNDTDQGREKNRRVEFVFY
tara:strand:+ start:2878 stop:4095 length:1218 start_codon:yes stop_codon:yes gene_type:complete